MKIICEALSRTPSQFTALVMIFCVRYKQLKGTCKSRGKLYTIKSDEIPVAKNGSIYPPIL